MLPSHVDNEEIWWKINLTTQDYLWGNYISEEKIMRIELQQGKYIYEFDEASGKQEIYRHGELWRHETGDGFLLALAQRIEELEDVLAGYRALHNNT